MLHCAEGSKPFNTKWNMPIAILSGDLMMIKATQLLCKSETEGIESR
jgi:geranylgeranyl pyrophosphate synthase